MKKIPVKKVVICLLIIVIIYVPALYRLYGKFPLVPKRFVNDAAGRVVDGDQNVFVLSAEQASSLAAVLSEYKYFASFKGLPSNEWVARFSSHSGDLSKNSGFELFKSVSLKNVPDYIRDVYDVMHSYGIY